MLAIAWISFEPPGKSCGGIAGRFVMLMSCGKVAPRSGLVWLRVPYPPAGIHVQMLQVCQAAALLGASGMTAWKCAKRIEVDSASSDGVEKSIQESRVTQLIIGVVRDVLRHVFVENLESVFEGVITERKLGVLLPEISLDQLRCRQESQNSDVAVVEKEIVWFMILGSRRGRLATLTRAAAGAQKRGAETKAAKE